MGLDGGNGGRKKQMDHACAQEKNQEDYQWTGCGREGIEKKEKLQLTMRVWL